MTTPACDCECYQRGRREGLEAAAAACKRIAAASHELARSLDVFGVRIVVPDASVARSRAGGAEDADAAVRALIPQEPAPTCSECGGKGWFMGDLGRDMEERIPCNKCPRPQEKP